MTVTEYRKDGDFIGAVLFFLLMLAALELIYWLYWLKANTSEFADRFKIWLGKQQNRTTQDQSYPNVPLFIALAIAAIFIGLAVVLHITFPESCDPESRKWLFRVAICKQPLRFVMYSVEVGGMMVLGLAYLMIAYRSWRR
ncbi:hypothetical protein GGR34_003018 [Microvirga flocculans]|uniref:Uncharacterized protein n=1 Tax=Microvirga flocculans TaxID=217168 RepID=A0A7W6IH45_9HYPH|nr:hypothetical protein [Microvirga flocculans]MBB4041348.1 hypothetical protein [Microvirga flocculans]